MTKKDKEIMAAVEGGVDEGEGWKHESRGRKTGQDSFFPPHGLVAFSIPFFPSIPIRFPIFCCPLFFLRSLHSLPVTKSSHPSRGRRTAPFSSALSVHISTNETPLLTTTTNDST